MPNDELIGQLLLGEYQILELLGEGGMAKVYKARQVSVDRIVAIKTLSIQDPNAAQRFTQEVKIHSSLKHQNIVNAIDCLIDPSNGKSYFVMEFIAGENLETLLRSLGGIKTEKQLMAIITQICDALLHAHWQGIIHRDLKPGNVILVEQDGQVVAKLLDFGLAKVQEEIQRLTQAGKTVGSPPYMSPEQCMGLELDARSDIYSLGLMTYEMITGQPAYKDDNVMNVLAAHCQPERKPPSVSLLRDMKGTKQLDSLIEIATETDPDDRFQDIEEFKRALRFWYQCVESGQLELELPRRVRLVKKTEKDQEVTLHELVSQHQKNLQELATAVPDQESLGEPANQGIALTLAPAQEVLPQPAPPGVTIHQPTGTAAGFPSVPPPLVPIIESTAQSPAPVPVPFAPAADPEPFAMVAEPAPFEAAEPQLSQQPQPAPAASEQPSSVPPHAATVPDQKIEPPKADIPRASSSPPPPQSIDVAAQQAALPAGMVPSYRKANLVDNVYRKSTPEPPRPVQPAPAPNLAARPAEKRPWPGGREPAPQPESGSAGGVSSAAASRVPPSQAQADPRGVNAGTGPAYKKEDSVDAGHRAPAQSSGEEPRNLSTRLPRATDDGLPPRERTSGVRSYASEMTPQRNWVPMIVMAVLLIPIGAVVVFFATQLMNPGKKTDTASNITRADSSAPQAETNKVDSEAVGSEVPVDKNSPAEKYSTSKYSTGSEKSGLKKIAEALMGTSSTTSTTDVTGTWLSEWGPVNIKQTGSMIIGDWSQGAPPPGTITGTYDVATGIMEVEYYQPWDKTRGMATFQLTDNGKMLAGKWKQDSGEEGTWNLRR